LLVVQKGKTMLLRTMVKTRQILVVFCLIPTLFTQRALSAQTSGTTQKTTQDMPGFILAGLKAYKEKGPEEAVRVWIKESAIDGSKDALTQSNNLLQVQDYYGAYRDFEVVSIHEITPRTRVVYLVLDFDKGPLFAKFVAYRPDKDWILVNFNFNTKEEAILPTAIQER
jgi:hypothetical protein